MTLTLRESIAVAELAVYVPALPLALLVCFRQGITRQLGFVYLLVFTAIRVAGAALEILSQENPTNATYAEWAGILSSVGLSPLLLASIGLLKRVNDLVQSNSLRVRILQAAHLPCLIGLILGIYGGTKLTSDTSTATTFLEAAAVLFLVTFLLLTAIAGATWPLYSPISEGEAKIYLAVVTALPFLAVRLLYTLLTDFENNATFAISGGNAYVQLGMSVVEEMIVTILFIVVGLLAPRFRDHVNRQGRVGQVDGGVKPVVGAV